MDPTLCSEFLSAEHFLCLPPIIAATTHLTVCEIPWFLSHSGRLCAMAVVILATKARLPRLNEVLSAGLPAI